MEQGTDWNKLTKLICFFITICELMDVIQYIQMKAVPHVPCPIVGGNTSPMGPGPGGHVVLGTLTHTYVKHYCRMNPEPVYCNRIQIWSVEPLMKQCELCPCHTTTASRAGLYPVQLPVHDRVHHCVKSDAHSTFLVCIQLILSKASVCKIKAMCVVIGQNDNCT